MPECGLCRRTGKTVESECFDDDRKGNWWDNSVAESFFHTLKTELTYHCQFRTREEAKRAIFEYIEVFYNRERLHSANDYLSPVDYENQQKAV